MKQLLTISGRNKVNVCSFLDVLHFSSSSQESLCGNNVCVTRNLSIPKMKSIMHCEEVLETSDYDFSQNLQSVTSSSKSTVSESLQQSFMNCEEFLASSNSDFWRGKALIEEVRFLFFYCL